MQLRMAQERLDTLQINTDKMDMVLHSTQQNWRSYGNKLHRLLLLLNGGPQLPRPLFAVVRLYLSERAPPFADKALRHSEAEALLAQCLNIHLVLGRTINRGISMRVVCSALPLVDDESKGVI